MTNDEIIFNLQKKIDKYNLPETPDNIPRSGVIATTVYNDGTTEKIDRTAEFYLCKKYFVYFADNYSLYKDQKNKRIYAFKLYDFQRNLIAPGFINNKFIIFRKCRQIGVSVISGIYAVWITNFNIAQEVLIVSKTKIDAQKFKAKAMLTYDSMPNFLKCKTTRDGQNMTTLKLTNYSEIIVRAQSPDAGRGGTWSLVILDEAAFMPYAEEIWDSVFPALSESDGQAIVISTSNGVGNWYHKKWIEAEEGENDFYPIYVPWWKFPNRNNPWLKNITDYLWIAKEMGPEKCKEIKNSITKAELKTSEIETYYNKLLEVFICNKEDEALLYDGPRENKPWLKVQHDNASSVRKFNQEILAKFLGSGNTVISAHALERLQRQITTPLFKDRLNKNTPIKGLYIFQEPQEGISYTLLSDVMSGCGTDYSTFIIFRDDTLEQVAEYKNQLDTKVFAQTIKQVATYYHYAYVVIETNQGMSVFNELFLHETDPYNNMFYEFKRKAYRGLHTGPRNKKLMLDEFMYCIDNNIIKIYGKRTLGELEVFVWDDRGRPQASRGYNDDLILPIMFLGYLLKYGNRKTKGLGFATSDQTIGKEKDWETDEEAETLYRSEAYAQVKIQDDFGLDWESYKELMR